MSRNLYKMSLAGFKKQLNKANQVIVIELFKKMVGVEKCLLVS